MANTVFNNTHINSLQSFSKRHGITILILSIFLASCNPTKSYVSNQGAIYGTIYHLTYESPNGKDVQDEIEVEMQKLNSSLSTYDPEAVISKVNKNEEVVLDDYFLTVFNRAMEISEITNGAFDITVAPMVNVWGFGFKNKEQVTQELIDSLKTITGYKKIHLKDGKVVKDHPNTMLDCSAIAKGYACDVVANFLREKGCENYMVEIGGEVVAYGENAKGKAWSIGISNPKDDEFLVNQSLKAVVKLPSKALATSGNYRNFYVEDGKKYAHTIDPKTGYPVQHSLLSSTVLADNCMTADAYATAFMVMGLEKSIELANSVEEIEVYFIYSDEDGNYKTYASNGFKSHLVKEN
ncbi:FAD:protein FMN transferase [Sunxiuqinia sp. A32]|uniref:FAD:protein FMN transferase n=1 Tax=Sunxiuqinia sp. A32 TaxID=3461496 RepID=UPI0040460639